MGFVRRILVGLMMFAAMACERRESMVTQFSREKILLKGNGSEPRSLDLHLIQTTTEHHIMMAMFEGLVNEDAADDTTIHPGVAERWESHENFTRWKFHLRHDAKWSDGRPLVAEDFVKSYKRQLSPSFGALYPEMLFKLRNAQAFNEGKLKDFDEVGVRALDEHTLEMSLNGPIPYFLSVLLHFTWYPVPTHVIEKFGELEGRFSRPDADGKTDFNKWTRPGNMVSNGAFKLKEWKFKEYIEVDRNPYYWDSTHVKLNGVRFMVVTDVATEERMFRTGSLHITETLGIDRIPHYRDKFPQLIRIYPYLGTYFYRINVTLPQFKDVRVRQALNLAVDRESLVNRTLQAAHSPAWGLTPPMKASYDLPRPIKFDPVKARELLAEAGYPEGKGFKKFSILVNDTETHILIAEVVQEMWKRHLGLEVGIRTESSSVFYDTQNRLDYDVARAGWIADFVEPISFLDMWTKGNQNNMTGWENTKFDKLIEDSYTATDPLARGKLMLEAENLFMAENVIIPIYWYNRQILIHPAVKGWHVKTLDNHPWRDLDLGEETLPNIR